VDARWFDRRELLQLWREHGSRGVEAGYRQELPGLSDPKGRTMVSSWMLCCLDALEGGGGVSVTEVSGQRSLELAPAGMTKTRLYFLASRPTNSKQS